MSVSKFSPPAFLRRMSRGSLRQTRRPSRVVLSTEVADNVRKPRETSDHGINRRVANLPVAPRIRAVPTGRSSGKERPDFKHMKMAQSLSLVSRTQRSATDSQIDMWHSFDDFDLLPSIKEGVRREVLKDLTSIEPTPVQSLVIPILTGQIKQRGYLRPKHGIESFLIAAETGSGKTLAYILPVLDYLKRQEIEEPSERWALPDKEEDRWEESEKDAKIQKGVLLDFEIPTVESSQDRDNIGKPRAIILVPTSELVKQVGSVVKSISHAAKLRSAFISRDFTGTVIRNRLFSGPIDIVISTPHLLASIANSDPKMLSKCSHIVIDEADSLFDRTFTPLTTSIISRAPVLERLILCSATIPKSLDTRLRKFYPQMQRLVTSKIHTIPRRVQLTVIDIDQDPYRGNKPLACADMLSKISKEDTEAGFMKKVIVFVNRREATTELASYLREKGFDVADMGRDTSDRKDSSVLGFFVGPKVEADSQAYGISRMKVLVTTDIASRGVDTKTVKNVLLYDVPYSTIDFIHRLGRTGRMGRRGRAIVLVDGDTNKAWVKEVKKYSLILPPSPKPMAEDPINHQQEHVHGRSIGLTLPFTFVRDINCICRNNSNTPLVKKKKKKLPG